MRGDLQRRGEAGVMSLSSCKTEDDHGRPFSIQLALFDTSQMQAADDSVYSIRHRPAHREARGASGARRNGNTRNLVLGRDHYTCHICGRRLPEAERLATHHWKPVRVAPWLWCSLA